MKLIPLVPPGEILVEEFLKPLEVSEYRLAKSIAVPPRRINEIVHGKRAITVDTALRLGKFFGTTPQFWLYLQTDYELRKLEREGNLSEILQSVDARELDSRRRDSGLPPDSDDQLLPQGSVRLEGVAVRSQSAKLREDPTTMKQPGLDHRHRDKDGRIDQKRGDTLNKNLSRPIEGFSLNARLDTIRRVTGETSEAGIRREAAKRR
ncbi:MAG TPA: HigA family addiction module antitoxin [Chthoniobacter sp.]|jgi:addiction module HigA family antidote